MRGAIAGWSAALILLGASCCAEQQAGVTDCADFLISPSEFHMQFAGRPGTVTQQEHTFVCQAAIFGRAQILFAGMAQRQAANPAVARFAGRTLEEQAKMKRRLFRLAEQQDGIVPPRGLDASHLAMRDQLATLSGDAFDRAYLRYAVEDGRAAIAVFSEEASSGAEPNLNRFAAVAVPLLEQRVRLAQSIMGQ